MLNYIMHIPKTAGLSLQGLARRRHKKAGTLELVYTQEQVEKGFEDRPELETVMGHFRFGYHRFSEKPFRYFTFLREPVQHVISHFHYTKDHPEKFEFLPEGIDNLLDFARCPYGYNLQTRFISGMENIQGREEEALEQAKANLDAHFEVIGLTGQFDLSLLMMGQALGWKILYYVKENTGQERKKHPAPSETDKQELLKLLRWDRELYAYAEKIFEKQIAQHPELVKRLASFQRENIAFQKLNPSYIRLKKLFR